MFLLTGNFCCFFSFIGSAIVEIVVCWLMSAFCIVDPSWITHGLLCYFLYYRVWSHGFHSSGNSALWFLVGGCWVVFLLSNSFLLSASRMVRFRRCSVLASILVLLHAHDFNFRDDFEFIFLTTFWCSFLLTFFCHHITGMQTSFLRTVIITVLYI